MGAGLGQTVLIDEDLSDYECTFHHSNSPNTFSIVYFLSARHKETQNLFRTSYSISQEMLYGAKDITALETQIKKYLVWNLKKSLFKVSEPLKMLLGDLLTPNESCDI